MQSKTGFRHDEKDVRDFMLPLGDLLKTQKLPEKVDLSSRFTSVEDQGKLGSCTAQAVVGLMEYLRNVTKKDHENYLDLSRLFLYKITRNLMGYVGDTGASLRACMHAARTIGVCPEKYYPYNVNLYDQEPSSFAYALAASYKVGMHYYRIKQDDTLLYNLKLLISESNPIACGVKVLDGQFQDNGNVYYSDTAPLEGWHAIVLTGYDDNKKMFKFRNSWGKNWGKDGYGWISYEYFTKKASTDHWTAQDINFVDISEI